MREGHFTYQAADGVDIFVHGWLCDAPKAAVHILHGMSEFSARYERLAKALAKAGYHTFAHDHRGHGKTLTNGATPGHAADEDSWSKVVSDAHGVNREIARLYPEVPIIGFGHSMGSFILQQLLYEHPNDYVAAALSGSNGKAPPLAQAGRLIARVERARLGKAKSSPVLQGMTFGGFNKPFEPSRTEYDWLSRDDEEVDIYIMDPLLGFACSTQTWIDFLDALPELAKPSNVAKVRKDIPLYLFSGSEDPVGDHGDGVRRLREQYLNAGIDDLEFKLYAGARHETLNEINRDEVTRDFIRWCDRVTDRL